MNKIIVHNGNKGIILFNVPKNEDRFLTMLKGNKDFYLPFANKKDLRASEPYEVGKNAIGLKNFKKVQYHFTGDGSGVVTNYDCNIYTNPTPEQLKFIGNSEIYCITFEN